MDRSRVFARTAVVLVGAACVLSAAWAILSPASPFLWTDGSARWLRAPEPFSPFARPAEDVHAQFRRRFVVEAVPRRAVLTLRAMKDVAVRLDGRDVLAPAGSLERWRAPREVDLAPGLTPGSHELLIGVMNRKGPALLLARAEALGLRTGDGAWEASADGNNFAPAEGADELRRPALALRFPSVSEAFVSQLPFLAPLFFLALAFGLAAERVPRLTSLLTDPSAVRAVATAAWVVLAANNLLKLPPHVGFDVASHMAYVRWIIAHQALPLATDGIQTFQSPLFYALEVPLLLVFERLFAPETAEKMLRLIPLACGVAQVQLVFHACRLAFPEDRRARAFGTLLGAFLPMNVYISQAVGNEPLAGVLSAWTIVLFLSATRAGFAVSARFWLGLGAVLGAALLAKVSAALLVGPLILFIAFGMMGAGASARRAAGAVGSVLGAAFAVCGWYYVRNWIVLGVPFIGGWKILQWWQDPGYRTARQFLAFGEALAYPVFSGARSFWDGYYSTLWLDGQLSGRGLFEFRPPWNDAAMLSGAWLGLLPTAGIVLGFWAAARRPAGARADGRLFAGACLTVYAGALFAMCLVVPAYSQMKATYTLGVLPCYALLGGSGLAALSMNRVARALVAATLVVWAASSYRAYFVIG